MVSSTDNGELGITLRRVLFSGLLSAIAVILGWLIYFAFLGGLEVLAAALIGAAVAGLIHGGEHYFKTAARERAAALRAQPVTGDPAPNTAAPGTSNTPAAETTHDEDASHRDFLAAIRSGAIIVGFASIACVHLAAELTHELLRPCLMSIVTLVPIGMFFGMVFSADERVKWSPQLIVLGIPIVGALIGLGAAAIATAANWLMGEPLEFWSYFAWWALVGMGLFAVSRGGRLSPGRAAGGITVCLVLVLSSAWGSSKPAASGTPVNNERHHFGPASAWVWMMSARDNALRAPDVPTKVWNEAARHGHPLARAHDAQAHTSDEDDEPSRWGDRLARWCGCAALPAPTSQPTSAPTDRAKAFASSAWYAAMYPDSVHTQSDTPLFYMSRPAFDSGRVVCDELRRGSRSGLFRSWLVIALFAVGLGCATFVEATLRPADYPSSRTRRNDTALWALVGLLVLGGGAVIRATRVEEHIGVMPRDYFARIARFDTGGAGDAVDQARAWGVARDQYMVRFCRDIAAHGFNAIWFDRIDHRVLAPWMEAARLAGLQAVVPTTNTPGDALSGTDDLRLRIGMAREEPGPLAPYRGDPVLLAYALGSIEHWGNKTLADEVALHRGADDPRPTLVEFSDAFKVGVSLERIHPPIALWTETALKAGADTEACRAFRAQREQVYILARQSGAALWIVDEVPGLLASRTAPPLHRLTQPPVPEMTTAELRWQAWTALQHGAKGFGYVIRNRPPREGPRPMFTDSNPSVVRESQSELYAEAAAILLDMEAIGPIVAELDPALEKWVQPLDPRWAETGPVRARPFVHSGTRQRYLVAVNDDTQDWQRLTLPIDIEGDRFIDVRSGRRWTRSQIGQVTLDPGGGALLRIVEH